MATSANLVGFDDLFKQTINTHHEGTTLVGASANVFFNRYYTDGYYTDAEVRKAILDELRASIQLTYVCLFSLVSPDANKKFDVEAAVDWCNLAMSGLLSNQHPYSRYLMSSEDRRATTKGSEVMLQLTVIFAEPGRLLAFADLIPVEILQNGKLRRLPGENYSLEIKG